MKNPIITPLVSDAIMAALPTFKQKGTLAVSDEITFLDIDDDYIHRLYPLLQLPNVLKPAYFDEGNIGAHITVIYPEEKCMVANEDIGQTFSFNIQGLFTADIILKRYYALLVTAPDLLALRKRYGLPDKLSFKNHAIGFHITIGVEQLTAS